MSSSPTNRERFCHSLGVWMESVDCGVAGRLRPIWEDGRWVTCSVTSRLARQFEWSLESGQRSAWKFCDVVERRDFGGLGTGYHVWNNQRPKLIDHWTIGRLIAVATRFVNSRLATWLYKNDALVRFVECGLSGTGSDLLTRNTDLLLPRRTPAEPIRLMAVRQAHGLMRCQQGDNVHRLFFSSPYLLFEKLLFWNGVVAILHRLETRSPSCERKRNKIEKERTSKKPIFSCCLAWFLS